MNLPFDWTCKDLFECIICTQMFQPLHWCLLADFCNHTYIPECGTENDEDIYNRRLFIDECDLFEYNCDYETDYYPINYSDCFNIPARPCPTRPPCPSIPTCKDHRFHRMGRNPHLMPSRRMAIKPTTTKYPLPERMLKGKRRYSPTWKKKKRRTTRPMTIGSTVGKTVMKTAPAETRTKIIKKMTVRRNGKVLLKVVKAIIRKRPVKKTKHDSDFLE